MWTMLKIALVALVALAWFITPVLLSGLFGVDVTGWWIWVSVMIVVGAMVVGIAGSIRDNRENEVPAPRLVGEGYAHIRNRDYDKAIKSFERAIEIDPNQGAAYNGLGIAYGNKGEYAEEIKAYKRAIEIAPNYSSSVYNNLGIAYREKGQYGESIEAYKSAIRIAPNYANAHNGLGYTYAAKKEWYKARDAYEKALKINPNHADARKNLNDANSRIRPLQAPRPTIYHDADSRIRAPQAPRPIIKKERARCHICRARDGTYKRVYKSKSAAESAAENAKGNVNELEAYEAPCGNYHLRSVRSESPRY